MSKIFQVNNDWSLFMALIIYSFAFFLMAEGNEYLTQTQAFNLRLEENKTVNASKLSSSNSSDEKISAKSPIGRSIRDDYNRKDDRSETKKVDSKDRESMKKENELYSIVQHHQINNYEKELRNKDQEEKKKGKLQTVGGVFGDIIGVIISEVVRIFGNLVSDVAREVTAHGFVSIFKQFTDLTGIPLTGNNIE